jgi:positive regulator of sigma E activity
MTVWLIAQQTVQPLIVTLVDTPAPQVTLGDVILGSLGLTGVLVLIAAVLGCGVAFVLVRWHRRHPPELEHLPPVSPLIPSSSVRPSSQVQ